MRRTILLAVSLVGFAAITLAMQQTYPNNTGEVVLENDRVVVQRFVFEPGEWLGEHSHPGNAIVVILKGGEMTGRQGDWEGVLTLEDGSVVWQEATEAHDHGNTGDNPIELLVITFKEGQS